MNPIVDPYAYGEFDPEGVPETALPPVRSEPMLADADIFEGRAYELRDVAQWLDLNGQKDLGRQVRDLAAKVYEIAIEKRKANETLHAPTGARSAEGR